MAPPAENSHAALSAPTATGPAPSPAANGQQKPTPPPGAPPLRKRPAAANPLVARKPPKKRPPPGPSGTASSKVTNLPGVAPRGNGPLLRPGQKGPDIDAIRKRNEGWTDPKPEGAVDYPLFIRKKDLMNETLRHHVMKLAQPGQRFTKPNEPGIDPTNPSEFTRPVTLQRRDPRQPAAGREVKPEEQEAPEPDPAESEEAQKQAQAKAEREAQRALDNAQKAPVMKDTAKKQQPNNKKQEKKPGTSVHYQARTEQQKKDSGIRYEEALPWHLEDADGKNVWVGQYEAPLSDAKVALQIRGAGFHIIPLEKWYRFASKRGAVNPMSIEEAEKVMNKKAPVGRWAVRDKQREEHAKEMAATRALVNGVVSVKQESASFRSASRREKMDHDDIDMSGDEFQDDDETAGYEPDKDEDALDSKDRVRREQLGANLFGDADEKEVEKAEASEKKEEDERKLLGKRLKKALKRRDKQFQYDSDSNDERDPFASSDDDSDSEEDEDEDKKDEEKKGDKDKADASGTSSKGNSTPQGKKAAAADAAKNRKSLKRPGSPLVSDSSGNESSRKTKKKKVGPSASMGGSRSGTPIPAAQRSRQGAGSGSDGEGTAGEMSDGAGGKKKKHSRLNIESKATPTGSRAGSPAAAPAKKGAASPPRPGSPTGKPAYTNPPTPQEILNHIPDVGIAMKDIHSKFKERLEGAGLMPNAEFIQMVTKVAKFDRGRKLFFRKNKE